MLFLSRTFLLVLLEGWKRALFSALCFGCGCLIKGDKPLMIAAAVLSPGERERLIRDRVLPGTKENILTKAAQGNFAALRGSCLCKKPQQKVCALQFGDVEGRVCSGWGSLGMKRWGTHSAGAVLWLQPPGFVLITQPSC